MEEELMKQIYQKHIRKLKNLNVSYKSLVICFSGIPGSGKTYVAKILEKKYKGVRIRNDDIREIVTKLDKKLDLDEVTYAYDKWFFENYKFKNKLIILDSGIDRKYDDIFPLLKKKGYRIFIIRLKVSEKVYERRIKDKLGKLDGNYINRINDWKRQYKEFGRKVKFDIIIENEKYEELDLEVLFGKLDEVVR
ncbi:MAG: AAA family ATPase [archaeon]